MVVLLGTACGGGAALPPTPATGIPSQAPTAFAIYNDQGVWPESVAAFGRFLDSVGVEHREVSAADINLGRLQGFTGLYFPGGWSPDYNNSITDAGMVNIRAFVSNGGDYVGICAGAWFATARTNYQGARFGSPRRLFDGRLMLVDWTAVGPINGIAAYPDYTMTQVDLDPAWEATPQYPSRQVLCFGGPWFAESRSSQDVRVIARYHLNKQPAILEASYGKGRVLLSSVHLEIDTPGVPQAKLTRPAELALGKRLSDPDGSDWPLLEALLGD